MTLLEEVTFLITSTLAGFLGLATFTFAPYFLLLLLIFLEFNFRDGFLEIDPDYYLHLISLKDFTFFALSFEIDFALFFWIEIYDMLIFCLDCLLAVGVCFSTDFDSLVFDADFDTEIGFTKLAFFCEIYSSLSRFLMLETGSLPFLVVAFSADADAFDLDLLLSPSLFGLSESFNYLAFALSLLFCFSSFCFYIFFCSFSFLACSFSF